MRHVLEAHIEPHLPPYVDLEPYNEQTGPISLVHQISEHQVLSFHGVNHISDPDSPHYPELRQHWDDFLQATSGAPDKRLALVEGKIHYAHEFPDDPRAAEREAIERFGEGGLTCLWAEREGVEILRPELPTAEDAKKLLHLYIPEQVVTFYAIRQVTQLPPKWEAGIPTPLYEDYVTDYLAELRDLTKDLEPLNDYDFSYEYFRETHEYFLGASPSQEQAWGYRDILAAFKNHAEAIHPLTRTSEASCHNRDLFTGTVLVNSLIDYRSPYGPYGWYHARELMRLLNTAAERLAAGKSALPELEPAS